MHITAIELHDFRSHDLLELTPGPMTVFVGPNASGKSNVLEAIEIVSTGRSFRNPRWPDVVAWGHPHATIQMEASGESPGVDVEVVISSEGKRTWRSGGVTRRRSTEATRYVPAVTFTPQDLDIVRGPAEGRRVTIDLLGDQLSVTYGALRRSYARVIRQRNALLKEGNARERLDPWDEQLIGLGARLHVHRRRLVARVAEEATRIYAGLADSESLAVAVNDRCGVGVPWPSEALEVTDVRACLEAELSERRSDEEVRKVSLVGPHRDDLIFTVDGKDARTFASQGQQRTIALALKWAEVAVITDVLRRRPILLLDDVMSELDETRRKALAGMMQQEVQTFVTTTTPAYFEETVLGQATMVDLGA
ncbi:MAG: DNA replication/repair protein RecF [Aeromicrobium sp.]|nr:DNA replication/repair protein RecF [Aeromicrobium sp.]